MKLEIDSYEGYSGIYSFTENYESEIFVYNNKYIVDSSDYDYKRIAFFLRFYDNGQTKHFGINEIISTGQQYFTTSHSGYLNYIETNNEIIVEINDATDYGYLRDSRFETNFKKIDNKLHIKFQPDYRGRAGKTEIFESNGFYTDSIG